MRSKKSIQHPKYFNIQNIQTFKNWLMRCHRLFDYMIVSEISWNLKFLQLSKVLWILMKLSIQTSLTLKKMNGSILKVKETFMTVWKIFRSPNACQFLILNQKRIGNDRHFYFNCRNYCPALIDQYDVFDEIIKCLEQKQYKQYSVKAEKFGSNVSVPGTAGTLQLLLR